MRRAGAGKRKRGDQNTYKAQKESTETRGELQSLWQKEKDDRQF